MTNIDENSLDLLINIFGEAAAKEVLVGENFEDYQKDPISFLKEKLGVDNIYGDLIKLAESVRDNKVTIAQSATGVGKTFIASRLAIWFYLCFPGSQIICAAAPPENNLKEKLWGEISDVVYKNRKLFKNHTSTTLSIKDKINLNDNSDEELEGSSKHFIVGKTIPTAGTPDERKSKFSGSHAPFQLFVFDEGDAIPDEIYEAIDGCMSGDMARLLIMFNPKRKVGAAYTMIKNGLANVVVLSAFTHPNVITGVDVIPGAASRSKTVQRINEWSEPLKEDEDHDNSCFQVPDFLVGVIGISGAGNEYPPLEAGWRRVTHAPFSYMVLGQYPSSSANSLIDEVWIDNAVSRWKLYVATYGKDTTKGLSPILGMDVADEGADSCCVAKRYGNFIAGFEKWRGIDLDISSDKLSKIYAELDAYQANVEADGIGAAIPPKVSRTFYWKCENPECPEVDKTYLDDKIYLCPVCHKEMTRKHMNSRKVYVSSPSQKKCDFGKFDKLRDELAWAVADWLKKDPSAMIPEDKELREEMLAFEYFEDQSSGKIKVTSKKDIKKTLKRSPDKFASLQQAFYEPTTPRIRVISSGEHL